MVKSFGVTLAALHVHKLLFIKVVESTSQPGTGLPQRSCTIQITPRQISPFSIFTATVSGPLLLLMPWMDASITFPKAPCPKTFPTSGERTGRERKTTQFDQWEVALSVTVKRQVAAVDSATKCKCIWNQYRQREGVITWMAAFGEQRVTMISRRVTAPSTSGVLFLFTVPVFFFFYSDLEICSLFFLHYYGISKSFKSSQGFFSETFAPQWSCQTRHLTPHDLMLPLLR